MVGHPPLVVLVGPTGVGKTALACLLARFLPVEVVGADSRQIYRGMDIGTGKPTAEEQRQVRHHLIDVVNPDEPYHVARYSREARSAIAEITGRGKLPLLVGGTGLYVRALLRGLTPAPPADPALRARLRAEAAARGVRALHDRLKEVDPVAAGYVAETDLVRIVRSLEVWELTCEPLSRRHRWETTEPAYRLLMVGLTADRSTLYRRLDKRVDWMIAQGLLDEVKGLLAGGYGEDLPAMQGIGYRPLAQALKGRYPLGEAIDRMKRDTRRYAKRQWTWFAREPGIQWFGLEGEGGLAGTATELRKRIEAGGYLG